MAANKPIKGQDMMLFVGSGTTLKSIALATSHTLEITADTLEVSTKDLGGIWNHAMANNLSWTASSENLISTDSEGNGYTDLMDMMIKRQEVTCIFALEGNSTDFEGNKKDAVPTGGWTPKANNGYTGKAIVTSVSLNAANGEFATMSVQLQGVGELKAVSASTIAAMTSDKAVAASK